jgi:hypothetical protein
LVTAFSGVASAACVVGRCRDEPGRLLVCRVERWAPKRTRSARRRAKTDAERKEIQNVVLDGVAALAKAYAAPVVTDQHLPAVVRDGLRQRGVDRVIVQAWNGQTLTAAFRALRARVIANTILLPTDETLLAELTRVRSRTRAGQSAVEVPRTSTSHMDSALALAAAVHRLDSRGAPAPVRAWSSFKQPAATGRLSFAERRRRALGLPQSRPANVRPLQQDDAEFLLRRDLAARGVAFNGGRL